MEKKQTAMQSLFLEFKTMSKVMRDSGDDTYANILDHLCEREEVAVLCEKEQIMNDYLQGIDSILEHRDEEDYYNETYGK
jgi:hypothetical protein